VFHIKQILGKNGTSEAPEPVLLAIVQLFTWPQWGAMTMANWDLSIFAKDVEFQYQSSRPFQW